ncbi:MAG: 16S rRNA (guanine(966)-N(2))-methyltransferase RsmD [Candidatus Omnitrophica bacterium CG1_02_40_15]|nr:MAG: 16S rRNA (guanine(966)-N(2))-methyltransferase RsmD [Candidatus Omnitrophica bacterium CG1_02_40_15]
MKIIAGEYKGRIIDMPVGIRPTSDKVRKSLFEILKTQIVGTSFLDLYCGSGAIGIEALSRGAEKAVFIDNNHGCISILKRNLDKIGISKPLYDIYNKDCIYILSRGGFQTRPYDIVFLDPPYYKGLAKNTLIELSNCDILTPNALVITEVFKKESLPEELGVFKKIRSSKYGDTLLEFFEKPRNLRGSSCSLRSQLTQNNAETYV